MLESPSPTTRLVFLDWVRILAFLVLLLFHTGMYYVSWDWHVKSPQIVPGLDIWMQLSSPWRMDLLFLVSGVATASLFARAGATGVLMRSRAKRLGLPLLLGVFLIVPPQTWYEVSDKLGFAGSFGEFMRLYLSGYRGFCFAPGRCLILPTWNHLWFLPYLLVYTALLWLALRRWPHLLTQLSPWLSRMSGSAGLLWWPVAYLVLTRALLQPFFPDTRALVGDWFAHSQFAAMFLLGAVLAPAAIWPRIAQLRWQSLRLAVAGWLFIVAGSRWFDVPDVVATLLNPLLVSVQQWCAIVAVLGFAFRHLVLDGPWRRYLTQAVFPLYILHQTLIILLAKALLPLHWPPIGEAPVLFGATLALSLLAFEVVRRIDWLAPWMGVQVAADAPMLPIWRLVRRIE